jgi:uncharacterized protein
MSAMRALGAVLGLVIAASCSSGAASAPSPSAPAVAPVATAASSPAATPTPAPASALPPYFIESLRTRQPVAGRIEVQDLMFRGDGFAKHHVAWTSGGQTMTGTISLPDGPGPFPVVIVNHGHIPPERYWIGQDSGIFGDPMAAHGFISIAPNYVGYNGSGPGDEALLTNQRIAVTEMDLISSLGSLPQADATRVAVVGHSQGGGVSENLMVIDPRLRAVVLHAPVSSSEAENAARLHARSGSWPALGDPSQNAQAYEHVSPRGYFAAWLPPTLLVQGTADHTIPAEHTQATLDALQRSGVRAGLTWVPGADHDLVGGDLASAVAQQEAWIRAALGM